MTPPERVGPLRGPTPVGLRSPRSEARSLPPDLLREASRRLGILALVCAVLWIVVPFLGHFAEHAVTAGRIPWTRVRTSDFISLGGAALSLAVWLLIRRQGVREPQRVLDLGLVYLVLMSLALGLMIHWDAVPAEVIITPEISWIAVLVLIFAAIAPNSPKKMLVAAFISVSMNPLGMLLEMWHGDWDFLSRRSALLMHYPDYLLVGVAAVIARVVTKLGGEVTRAREMGSYRLGELLGRGGMGEVYRATHRMLARPAAIKLIRPETLGPAGAPATELTLKRFHREAEAAANLRSPHTVEIYDFGVTENGTLYFVMELLDGMDLETLVRRHGPVPPARAVHILRQVCESLAEAHAAGLVHRDVKPANIFVGRLGLQHDFVKVLDFGLVKPIEPGHAPSLATAEGMTPGTPAYMAPEVALGEPVDGRADVYALGCVAYFLLTGGLVFEAENALQMIARHLQAQPVPPSQRSSQPIPRALEQLVLVCLSKSAADRPDARECARALAGIAETGWGEEEAVRWWSSVQPVVEMELGPSAGSPVPAGR